MSRFTDLFQPESKPEPQPEPQPEPKVESAFSKVAAPKSKNTTKKKN